MTFPAGARAILAAMTIYAQECKVHEDLKPNKDRPAPYRKKMNLGRNCPCHCGSGKKFKLCCIGVN